MRIVQAVLRDVDTVTSNLGIEFLAVSPHLMLVFGSATWLRALRGRWQSTISGYPSPGLQHGRRDICAWGE